MKYPSRLCLLLLPASRLSNLKGYTFVQFKMFLPLKLGSVHLLKNPPWSLATILPKGQVLLINKANVAFFHEGKMVYQKTFQEAVKVYLTSDKCNLVIFLKSGGISILNVESMKEILGIPLVPQVLNDVALKVIDIEGQKDTKSHELKKLLGIVGKNTKDDLDLGLDLDFRDGSLLALLGNEALVYLNDLWYSYDIIEGQRPKRLYGHSTFFFECSWTLIHFVEGALLVNHLKAKTKVTDVLLLNEVSSSKAIIKAPSNSLYVVALDCKIIIVSQGQKLKVTEYPDPIVAVDVTFQSSFVLALSDKGQLFMQAINGDEIRLAFQQPLFRPSIISCHPAENSFVLSDGLYVAFINFPDGFHHFMALIDLLIAKALLLSIEGQAKPMKALGFQQVAFEDILQDYFGLHDHQKALGLYYDTLSLLMMTATSRKKAHKYSKIILKAMKTLVKSIKNDLAVLEWLTKATKILSLSPTFWPFLAFFVKFINSTIKTMTMKRPNDGLELLSNLSKWTLSLQRSVNIKATWFSPAYKAIYGLAQGQNDVPLMNLIKTNHAIKADEKASKKKPDMLAFFQGQYSKAIKIWEKLALTDSTYLLKVVNNLIDLGCYKELAFLVSWAFMTFSFEVCGFFEVVEYL